MTIITKTPDETLELGIKIGYKLKPGNIVTLIGGLGAGKTVIAKGIAVALKVKESVTSPTYNIVCEYSGTIPFNHLDLYRISDFEEFEMLGVDNLLYGNGVSVIEWSERIQDELPDDIIKISITREDSNEDRKIIIEGLEL